MNIPLARLRFSSTPAYFLGRPSSVYIDRYIRRGRRRRPSSRLTAGVVASRPGAIDDRPGIDAVRQGAEHQPAATAEARRAERLGHRGDRVTQQQRALEGEGETLGQPSRLGLRVAVAELGELGVEIGDEAVEPGVGAAGGFDLGEQRASASPVHGRSPAARRGR